MKRLTERLSILLLSAALAACGGGGGGSKPPGNTPPPGDNMPPPGNNNPPPGGNNNDDANHAPNASIAALDTRLELSLVTLDGTSSSDEDGDTLTYQWTQTAGAKVTLENANAASPTFHAPKVTIKETLTFQLTVSDGKGGSDVASVDVAINESDVVVFELRNNVFNNGEGTTELYLVHDGLEAPLRISPEQTTTIYANIQSIQISPDRRHAAFLADFEYEDVFELYVTALDGSGARKVSGAIQNVGDDETPDGRVLDFAWSPNSQWLAFRGDLDRDGVNWLYTVRLVDDARFTMGGVDETLDAAGASRVHQYAWRPQGDLVALSSWIDLAAPDIQQLYLLDPAAEDVAQYRVLSGDIDTHVPSFQVSPNGEYVAWLSHAADTFAEIHTTNVALHADDPLGAVVNVTGNALNFDQDLSHEAGVTHFIWSPAGDRLAFFANQHETDGDAGSEYRGCGRIMIVATDGSTSVQVLGRTNADDCFREFRFSPDGEHLATLGDFEFSASGLSRLYVDGALVSEAVAGSSNWTYGFFWSPDSQHIAYAAALDTNHADLYRWSLESQAQVRLSANQNGDNVLPYGWQWNPSNDEIAYLNWNAGTATGGLFITTLDSVDGSEVFDLNADLEGQPTVQNATAYSWTDHGESVVFSARMNGNMMLFRTERATGERTNVSADLYDMDNDGVAESGISDRFAIAGPPVE